MSTVNPELSISRQDLSRFGLEGDGALERHVRVLEAMVNPEWADELDDDDVASLRQWKKLHRSGIREIPLLRLDFDGGGMGGCGSSEISIFWSPALKTGLIVDSDVENGSYEVLGTFTCLPRFKFPADQVRDVFRYRFNYVVENDAISRLENFVEDLFPRESLRELWQEAAGDSPKLVAEALSAFERVYPPPKPGRLSRKRSRSK